MDEHGGHQHEHDDAHGERAHDGAHGERAHDGGHDDATGADEHTRRDVLRSAGLLTGAGLTGVAAPDAVPEGVPGDPPFGGGRGQPPTCGNGDATPPRPGPGFLYDDNPTPPQLQNTGGWSADPLMVSGTEGYDGGEYLYQDFVYDDHGADTSPGPTPPNPQPDATYGSATGDVVYPTDHATYRSNAADLLEFRARPVGGDGEEPPGVAYRVTLQTMAEADAAAVAIGIDTGSGGGPSDAGRTSSDPSDGRRTDWGHGLGDLGVPVDHVLVVSGDEATLDGATDGVRSASVDRERSQLEVVVDLDPGAATWTHHCVTGVRDPAASGIAFAPVSEQPTATRPGGANGQDVPPVFNVGFRFDEPLGALNDEPEELEREVDQQREAVGSRSPGYGNRRDHAQAQALAERDLSRFGADVDFARLRDGTVDRRIPESGFICRLYGSAFDLGTTDRFDSSEGFDADEPVSLGQVQPYGVYIPPTYEPEDPDPTPLWLDCHSKSATYTQYAAYSPDQLRQLGEANDTIVLTPEARGPSGWYQQEAEIDVFEAWRDLRNRYAIDEDRVFLGGYSMGGYATYKFGAQYPDLFAKAFAVVGPAGEDVLAGPTNGEAKAGDGASADPENTMRITDNLRHLPLLMWNGTNDQLVPFPGVVNYEQQLRDHGYRHELAAFPGYEHFTFAIRDDWGPGADFFAGDYLGAPTVTRSPARVTYRAVPDFDHDLGGDAPELVHDGAYWVHGIEARGDDVETAEGLVDAVSHADGYGAPVTEDFRGPGTEPAPHTKRGTRWGAPLDESPAYNALDVTLEGVDTATVYVAAAGLDPTRRLDLTVDSDGPATLVLTGSFGERAVEVSAGRTETTVQLCERGSEQ
jgi:dienelactone hydrolase